ncbi:hypothetical protein QE152_g38682 [Popillia japonica]|uniref:Uncharacterized protein n=1 Tax=Popillia japonica TaxID=7064 RepID=A0AAW1HVP9_POPJA
MGRTLRDVLPIQPDKLKPSKISHREVVNKMEAEKQIQKENFDRRHRVKTCRKLEEKERVWIKDQQKEGEVITNTKEPRSYRISTDKGIIRRNRKFLQLLPKEGRNVDYGEVQEEKQVRSKRSINKPKFLNEYV